MKNAEPMFQMFLTYLLPVAVALLAGSILFPLILRWSLRVGLVDRPDHRKLHKQAVPVIGGLCIGLSLVAAALAAPSLRHLVLAHKAVIAGILMLMVTGLADDTRGLSPKLRFMIQLLCAGMVAYEGIRVHSLFGLFGITLIPVWIQYIITILIITLLTNAINLIDGIDGLAGGLSLINCLIICGIALMVRQQAWLCLLLPLVACLLLFLRYNWHPARLFMGDGGSLFIGFLMASVSILMMQHAYTDGLAFHLDPSLIVVLISACFIIPAADIVRVFFERIQKGRSPFSADRTHLHHKLVRHNVTHGNAARKLLTLHCFIIILSAAAMQVCSIMVVIMMQFATVILYTLFLNFVHNYVRWFRFIRKTEATQPEPAKRA